MHPSVRRLLIGDLMAEEVSTCIVIACHLLLLHPASQCTGGFAPCAHAALGMRR